MPKYLAGRDNILEMASSQIKAITAGYPSRSTVLYGLRGTGKTVLLNAIESIANNEGVLVHHIEIEEKGSLLVPWPRDAARYLPRLYGQSTQMRVPLP